MFRAGVGAGGIGIVAAHHHVGEAVQHAIARRVAIDHLVVIDFDVATAVHTDLVVGGTTRITQAIVGNRCINSADAFINIVDRGAPEIDDLRSGAIEEERTTTRHANRLVERNDGVFLRGFQGIDLALASEVDM